MIYSIYGLTPPHPELMLQSLEAVLHVLVIIEISALLLMLLILAIIGWSSYGTVKQPGAQDSQELPPCSGKEQELSDPKCRQVLTDTVPTRATSDLIEGIKPYVGLSGPAAEKERINETRDLVSF